MTDIWYPFYVCKRIKITNLCTYISKNQIIRVKNKCKAYLYF